MTDKSKIQVAVLYLLGAGAVLFSLLTDLLRGRQITFGYAQLAFLLLGIVILLSAWFHQKKKLIPFFKNIQGWLFQESFDPQVKKKFGKTADILIIFAILLYSVFYFLGRWGGLSPSILVDKNGDAGALLTYAAALDAPQNFSTDQILNPEQQMFSYNGIYLPYIRFMAGLTGDYSLAFLTLLPVCFFLQLTSFYLLGKELFKNRFWAVLLSILSAVPIVYGFWDSWGLAYDPLPRFLFQSIAPFILLLSIKWKNSPKKWPWLMFGTSLLFFVHVISAPALAFMIWMGFFLFLPGEWKRSRKLLFQFINGLAFIIPYGLFVLSSDSTAGITTASGATYAEIMEYLKANFNAFLNIKASLLLYVQVLNNYCLLIPAILGIIVIFFTKSQRELRTNLVLIWLAACLFVSILIPSIEHAVENAVGIPPVEFDLVRNLRYSIPLLEIISISGFIAIQKRLLQSFTAKPAGITLTLLVYLIAGVWVFYAATLEFEDDRKYGLDFAIQEIKCVARGDLFCPTRRQVNEAEVLSFIHDELPIESTFLSMPDDELANEIRYAGMRSVSYTHIDKNRIVYSHFKKAVDVEATGEEWSEMLNHHTDGFNEWALALSCEYGATHWLVDEDLGIGMANEAAGITKVFENGSFSVIELPECP